MGVADQLITICLIMESFTFLKSVLLTTINVSFNLSVMEQEVGMMDGLNNSDRHVLLMILSVYGQQTRELGMKQMDTLVHWLLLM